VVGLGGSAEYREAFHSEASTIYEALTGPLGLPAEDVVYLGERIETAPDMISDVSTRANVMRALSEIAQSAGPDDRVLVMLIGHGTSGTGGVAFNLTGPDLTPTDFELASAAFPTQRLALVATGSASGGFVSPLSGPNRVLIAATRTERERNATRFGRFFADALAGGSADLDHDERVSLLEAYTYAREEVARSYEEDNVLMVEHAILDDNGDGQGTTEAGLDGPDGILAANFTLGGVTGPPTTTDPVLARLLTERAAIERQVEELRQARGTLTEEQYLDRLEPLMIDLALKNREIEEAGGS